MNFQLNEYTPDFVLLCEQWTSHVLDVAQLQHELHASVTNYSLLQNEQRAEFKTNQNHSDENAHLSL